MRKAFLFVSLLLSLGAFPAKAAEKHTFQIAGGHFVLDGKPTQFFCGEMHPARIPREYWQDRLHMVKAMGMNSISVYMFWNVHEPVKGKYNFSGNADIAEFVRLAQQEGLWVMLRPSPYVCAEWEFGGYPWWLLKEKGLKVRSKDPRFLSAYTNYVMQVGKQLAPLQVQNGGPVVMMQIENEYGFYGSDKEYLKINKDIFRQAGFDCELFTCDPPYTIENGHLPGVYAAVNGGVAYADVIKTQNKINGGGPYFISEWYPAWFDVWGKKHNTTPVEKYINYLDTTFCHGISLNMYMCHGGSNFGYMNGANYDDDMPYQSQTQSYDYDAPINEAGNATPKYYAYRKMARKYLPADYVIPEVPAQKKSIIISEFNLPWVASIDANRPIPVKSPNPLSFEDLNQGYGYVLYEASLPKGEGWLKIKELRDYGIVLLNGKRIGTVDRRKKQDSVYVKVTAPQMKISILVENLGRLNFGVYLTDNRKGITEKVLFNKKVIKSWSMYGYPFQTVDKLKYVAEKPGTTYEWPVLRKGTFEITELGDTYLDMSQFGKGSVWVNGHHIGRYWQVGPQQTLYIPAPWLKVGKNEVVVFEMLKMWQNKLKGLNAPVLDKLNEELFIGPTSVQQIQY